MLNKKLINETSILNNKIVREQLIKKTDILNKVGTLLLLPNTQLATQKQIASYYEVGIRTIESLVLRNIHELIEDGCKTYKKSEIIEKLNIQDECLTSLTGKTIVNLKNSILEIPNRGLKLFPKRAILRIGMLLRDSEIAKEIRRKLLDIVHDTEEQTPEIIENIVSEINEEKQLMLDRVEAELSGDYNKVCIINAKLFSLKNKRIQKLEINIQNITTNALTIQRSKDVINRIVRTIAITKYNNMFGKAWGEFYKKLNYKLGINIKARGKKKGSYLNSLTDKELQKTEKIARSWALQTGLDLQELLNIA